ncbi:MAG: tetratricopeptide repeat protein [Bacteroidales bacterium]|nr:tetratricopeptide repeat protein [Bacteroidales bacterium]
MSGCWFTAISFAQTIDADSMYLKARDLAFSGEYGVAREISRKLLSLYPGYFDAIILIGKTHVWEHSADSARVSLTRALDIAPDSYEVLLLLINNAIEDGKYDEAVHYADRALSYYPGSADVLDRKMYALLLTGKNHVTERRHDQARNTLVPLLDITPDSYDILILLADNAIADRKYDEAILYADRALTYYPNDTEILYRKAHALLLKGENTASLEVVNRIFAIDPDHAGAKDLEEHFKSLATENLYRQATEEVRAGQNEKARETLREVLAGKPGYFDASLLMAYTYGWEGKYDSARLVTRQLAETNPNNYELLNLMIHLEVWDREYEAALSMANKALDTNSSDENFLYQKARIQYLMQNYWDAKQTVEQLLTINPEHAEGNKLYQLLKTSYLYKDYVFLENYYEFAKLPYLSHKMVQSLGVAKWEKFGTFIARVNIGSEMPDLWSPSAFQYELEAYPEITSSNYLYLNYAFSASSFFPEHRGAFEFFQRLPKGFEASLGLRFLYWQGMNWIYTGSVSWLHGNHYVAFRPYFKYSVIWVDSYNLTYRYYFTSEREDYVYAVAGFGSYSDEFLQLNPDPGNSYMLQVGALKFINSRWNVQASAGYSRDDGYRNRWQAMAGVRYYFNMFHR